MANGGPKGLQRWLFKGDGDDSHVFLTKKTVRKGFITLTDQAFVSITNFLTGVIIGRTCSKEELGLYALGFGIVVFVVNLQNSVISIPYIVHSPRLTDLDRKTYTTSTIVHQISFSILVIVSLLAGNAICRLGYGPEGLQLILLVLAVVITFILFREYARQISFSRLKAGLSLSMDIFVAAIQLGGLLIIVLWGTISASRAFMVSGIACGFATVMWATLNRDEFRPDFSRVFESLKLNWSLGKWNLAAGFANTVGLQLFPWLLASFHGAASVGVFAACMGTVLMVNPLVIGMGNFLGPKIMHSYADGGVKEVHAFIRKSSILMCMIMGVFCAVMIVFGGNVMQFIYGSKYVGFGKVVGILALGQLLEAGTMPINGGLYAMGRPEAIFKSFGIGLLFTIFLGTFLTKSFSVTGSSFSILSGNAASAAYRWIVYKKDLDTFLLCPNESVKGV